LHSTCAQEQLSSSQPDEDEPDPWEVDPDLWDVDAIPVPLFVDPAPLPDVPPPQPSSSSSSSNSSTGNSSSSNSSGSSSKPGTGAGAGSGKAKAKAKGKAKFTAREAVGYEEEISWGPFIAKVYAIKGDERAKTMKGFCPYHGGGDDASACARTKRFRVDDDEGKDYALILRSPLQCNYLDDPQPPCNY
jgi:hypothetical protein